jgi:hypothetical protein
VIDFAGGIFRLVSYPLLDTSARRGRVAGKRAAHGFGYRRDGGGDRGNALSDLV